MSAKSIDYFHKPIFVGDEGWLSYQQSSPDMTIDSDLQYLNEHNVTKEIR